MQIKWKVAFTAFLLAVVGLITVNQARALETTPAATARVQSQSSADLTPVTTAQVEIVNKCGPAFMQDNDLPWVATTIHSPPGTTCLEANMGGSWTVSAIESNTAQSSGIDATGAQWKEFTREGSPSDGSGVNKDTALTWWKTAPAYAIYNIFRGADELNVFCTPPPAATMLAVTDEACPAADQNAAATQSAAITTSELRLDGFANIAEWPMQTATSRSLTLVPEVATFLGNNDTGQRISPQSDVASSMNRAPVLRI